MLEIPQELINRLICEHEPRTKKFSSKRLYREAQYKASNDELNQLEGSSYERKTHSG